MELQSWFNSQLHAKVEVEDQEERFVLQAQINIILKELIQCENEISRLKETNRYALIWKLKSRLEASPFMLASRYGYYSIQPKLSIQLLAKQRQHLVQLLGQISSKPATLPLPMITGQVPIWQKYNVFASFLESNWLNLSIGLFTVVYGRHLISQLDPILILDYTKDGISAVRNLLSEWIWCPMLEIWHTVRYSKFSARITDEAILKQDYDALNRMVHDYGMDAGGELQAADFEHILKEYERNMKNPIKGALMGDLIRLILIQVQKGKVDLGRALLSLDKLMRANELNFELLTVIPVVVVLYLTVRKGMQVWREISGRSQRHLTQQYKTCLRHISACITDHSISEDEKYGGLIFESYKIVSIVGVIQGVEEEAFKVDLAQLIDSKTPNSDRLWIVHRMHTLL